MRKIGIYFSLFFCLLIINPAIHGQKIIAYYTGNGDLIKDYPVDKLSHIIFSFLRLKDDSLVFANEQQKESLTKIVALKKLYPALKIMVSVGGWGGCAPCSDLFADETHRNNFAKTTVALFREYGIDGLDLDWEYPAIEGYPGHKFQEGDRNNFTLLVKALRNEMGDDFILSFAAGGFTNFLENSIDWDAVTPNLDFINLMTYDLVGGYSKMTGHHTPLYGDRDVKESTAKCINWLLKHPIPSQKLIIGAAFYARVWEDVTEANRGLFQPGTFKQSVAYKNFGNYFNDSSGFKYHWDKKSKAPYRYNTSKQLFATFDDERSIAEKVKFIRRKKLGGMMFWELSLDAANGGLVDKIYDYLHQ